MFGSVPHLVPGITCMFVSVWRGVQWRGPLLLPPSCTRLPRPSLCNVLCALFEYRVVVYGCPTPLLCFRTSEANSCKTFRQGAPTGALRGCLRRGLLAQPGGSGGHGPAAIRLVTGTSATWLEQPVSSPKPSRYMATEGL